MDNNLLKYIRSLSTRDRKNLQGKALKTAEETGTLAQKVLAYTGEAGNRHRVFQYEDVLSDAADVILCALSVAHDLGASDDEIEQMMWLKARKWEGLQFSESEENGRDIFYEVHLTVDVRSADEVQAFEQCCAGISQKLGTKVKPLTIGLMSTDFTGDAKHVMTSSKCVGTLQDLFEHVRAIERGLTSGIALPPKESSSLTFQRYTFDVVRRKVETVPWHPCVPCEGFPRRVYPEGAYFESHVEVLVSAPTTQLLSNTLETIGAVAQTHGAHLSTNARKTVGPSGATYMVTLRRSIKLAHTVEGFENVRNLMIAAIDHHTRGWQNVGAVVEVGKVITEVSIIDSEQSLDDSWINDFKKEQQ